ncbi:unnamed protein product [Lactuca virosa]|uniref:Uncharacterized protein n=1 Tax=Lactuca virosa TaxID=75947 RepID=A0AAU9MUF3_9ASTR|nr:unnamed protein product [Lactuca virosa]
MFPCKSSFTAAGCYLCPSPSSKGTKLLICCSVNSTLPMKMKSFYAASSNEKVKVSSEMTQIIEMEDYAFSKHKMVFLNTSDMHFLNTKSFESILSEAKRVKILSESTHTSICSLQKNEHEKFKLKTDTLPDNGSCKVVELVNNVKQLHQGQIGHFMDRFLVSWEFVSGGCCGCVFGQYSVMEVCHMVDDDWLYLSKLSKSENLCSDFVKLTNPEGQILSIPNIGFIICPCLKVSAKFNPRVPLGPWGWLQFVFMSFG